MVIHHEVWRSQNAVIFQFVTVTVAKPNRLLGGCQFLGGTCFLHIQYQMNGVMQLGYMGKMPWILVTENHGREGAVEVGRGLSRPRSIEQRITKQPLPIFFFRARLICAISEGRNCFVE